MRFSALVLCLFSGLSLGLCATWLTMEKGIGLDAQSIEGWAFVPRVGAPDIDPYRRLKLFTSGELPLASGEGFSLTLKQDRAGRPLEGACRYQLSGALPVARFWTLTLTTPDGRLWPNPAARFGFTSSEIIRTEDAPFSVVIGPGPLAGNWLPSPPAGHFILTLRFYETPLSASATQLDARSVPALSLLGCAS